MKLKVVIFLFIFVTLLFNSYSQDVRVSANLDTNTVFIGDTLRLNLTVEAKKEMQIVFPEIPNDINGIEVRSKSAIDTIQTDDSYKLVQIIGLQPFDTGNIAIPSFAFQVINNSNVQQAFIATDSLMLTVNSFRSDTAKTIIDIKEPLDEPLTFWDYLPYIIAGILLIAGAVFGYRLWKKRKKEPAEPIKLEIEKIPYVWALEELGKLEKKTLWQIGKYKQYYINLSDIIREYIERKFNQPALEMISSEIVINLKMLNIPTESIEKLKEILRISDLVKFAKYIPNDNENIETFSQAVEFVKKTSHFTTVSEMIDKEPIA